MKNKLKLKAESLIETIIAVFILATGATAAFAFLVSSLRMTENIENRIIAINLAREGIEAVRTIRDSNWIEHGGSRREYWNCVGDGSCSNKIENGSYIADLDTDNMRWVLYKKTGVLDLSDGENENEDGVFLLLKKNYGAEGEWLYTHDEANSQDCLSDTPATCEITVFFREIKFNYLDAEENVLEVHSRVVWWQDGIPQDVELVSYITDFLGRDINTVE